MTLITHCPHCTKTLTAAEAIEKWCTICAKPVAGRKEAA
jgi:endogenous inhibitor of DNA gyrase (YacG/DUF329 family)